MGKKRSAIEISFDKKIADRLKLIKKRVGVKRETKISLDAIAGILNVSRRQVDNYISGHSGLSLYNFYRMIHAFKISLTDIIYMLNIGCGQDELQIENINNSYMSDNGFDEEKMNDNIQKFLYIQRSNNSDIIGAVESILNYAYDAVKEKNFSASKD